MATDRSGWRHAIRKGTEDYENTRQSSQQVIKACSNQGQNHHCRVFH